MAKNYERGNDPEDHFSEFTSALREYREQFSGKEVAQIDEALDDVGIAVEELRSQLPPERDDDDYFGDNAPEEQSDSTRSIFDDVDE